MIYCDKVSNSECSTWTFIITVVEVFHDDQGAFLLPISISYLPSLPLGSVGIPVLSNSSDSRSRNFGMIFQSLSLPIWEQKIWGDVNIYHRSMLKKLHFSCRIASLTGKLIKKKHKKKDIFWVARNWNHLTLGGSGWQTIDTRSTPGSLLTSVVYNCSN